MDESALANWLETLRPGSSLYSVLMLLGGLRQLTGWGEATLCRHLGCPGVGIDAEDSARTAHSLAYLEWVTELCAQVDPSLEQVRSRREVVVAAFELCDGAGGPVLSRVERCHRAMLAPLDGDLSGMSLLGLGEVPAAFAQAARALPDGPVHEDQERFDVQTPQLRVGHLHLHRLEFLLTGTPQRIQQDIGATVALRMHEHLRECPRCQMVAAERGLRWDVTAALANAA